MSAASPLTLPLAELRRGSLERAWRLEDPTEVWPELPAAFEYLEVEARATAADRGGVHVEGAVRAEARLECRRCLDPVRRPVEAELDAWFRADEMVEEDEEGLWPLEPTATEIDLAEPVREEIWLATPSYALCRPDCPGMCPRCGARLEEGPCGCPDEPADVRWAELEKLRSTLTAGEEGG